MGVVQAREPKVGGLVTLIVNNQFIDVHDKTFWEHIIIQKLPLFQQFQISSQDLQ